jgi:hypothetical protein
MSKLEPKKAKRRNPKKLRRKVMSGEANLMDLPLEGIRARQVRKLVRLAKELDRLIEKEENAESTAAT